MFSLSGHYHVSGGNNDHSSCKSMVTDTGRSNDGAVLFIAHRFCKDNEIIETHRVSK